jgi:hypothetical protein
VFSRSLARKVLGNEEFCMQIDAHSDFVKDWDKVAREEWRKTQNEFGVISHVPARLADKAAYQVGGAQINEVPRQCMLRFLDNGFPDYFSPVHPDGKSDGKVVDLQRPLLGHGWSAAFSFAKCHLEETVPYDIFSVWAMPVEQFSRFARMWTRGYVRASLCVCFDVCGCGRFTFVCSVFAHRRLYLYCLLFASATNNHQIRCLHADPYHSVSRLRRAGQWPWR